MSDKNDPEELDDILDSALDDFIALEAPTPSTSTPAPASSSSAAASAADAPPVRAVEDALDELNAAMARLSSGVGADGDDGGELDDEKLQEFVNKLAEEFGRSVPGAAANDEGTGSGEGVDRVAEGADPGAALEGMVEKIVGELLSKDVLRAPMEEMRVMYEKFLGESAETLPAEDLERYRKQQQCVIGICDLYARDGAMRDIMDLLQQMQDCGSPPPQVIDMLSKGDDSVPDADGALNASELAKLEELQRQCPIQ